MTAILTDEQKLLSETVTRLAEEFRASPLEILEQRSRRASWEVLADLDLVTMRLPEECGGSGASAADVLIVAEALARGPAVVPFVGPLLAAELLHCSDLDGDRTMELARGATIVLESGVAWDAAGARRGVAVRRRSDGELSVVAADLPQGSELPSTDITRVIASGEQVLAGDVVAQIAPAAHAQWEALALLALSADLVGTMQGALDLAVRYARDRQQFGQHIGAFQAIQQLLADSYVSVQAAKSATEHGASVLQAQSADALLAARVAKAYSSRVALEVCEASMLVHGAMGTTWESLCHVYTRRAVAGAQLLGAEVDQLQQISVERLGGD